MREAVQVSHDSPVLLDHFLNDAIEVDVDAVCDGEHVLVCGIMEHIEEAGIHSGDSACSLPPFSLTAEVQQELGKQVTAMAKGLGVVGLMNTQFAIQGDTIYVLEVNPRASRTVPFVSKATGVAWAKVAARCMAGISLAAQGITHAPVPSYFSVKESVFPFAKFPGVDPLLGPEMRSTGEVMGIASSFGAAFCKAQNAASSPLPTTGKVFVSVRDADKNRVVQVVKTLISKNFDIVATAGTCALLEQQGIPCTRINKVLQGRPHIIDAIKNDDIALVINTTNGRQALSDSFSIRRSAVMHKVPYTTTIAAAEAIAEAISAPREQIEAVHALQDLTI